MPDLSRRGFLAGTGGLTLCFLAGLGKPAHAGTAASFNAFLAVKPDSSVEVRLGVAEMGQGASTAMGMIAADELGAEWRQVAVRAGVLDPAFRQPGLDEQLTAGSTSVRVFHQPLRHAAAAAREMLIAAAADHWGVNVGSCDIREGLLVGPGGRTAELGEFAIAAAGLPVPAKPVLRAASSGLLGRSLPRPDIPGKVDGTAQYAADVRLPGMVFATVRQAPVFGALLEDPGASRAREMPGVLAVVELRDAVAVVADRTWRALAAARALDPRFSATPDDAVDSAAIRALFEPLLDRIDQGEEQGDHVAAFAKAARVIEARYATPYLSHSPMEPMSCTVRVADGLCELWAPTQSHDKTVETAVKLTGLASERIILHPVAIGGAFGRRLEVDFVEQAIRIAMAVRRPVQLVWSREEDTRHGFYRPASIAKLRAAIDHAGELSAFTGDVVSQSYATRLQGRTTDNGYEPFLIEGLRNHPYAFPARRTGGIIAEAHVPVGAWRSTGRSNNTFFLESFIDEIAHALGKDPYTLRRTLLADDERARAVLDRAARGWRATRAAGRARGLAFCDGFGSKMALMAEVSLERGTLQVHRLDFAIDCGRAIHPDGILAQVEGGLVFGLSAALWGAVSIRNGAVVEQNFGDYRLLPMRQMPEIEVSVIESDGPLGGVGEAAVPLVAPALANALLALTGEPVRELPLAAHGLA